MIGPEGVGVHPSWEISFILVLLFISLQSEGKALRVVFFFCCRLQNEIKQTFTGAVSHSSSSVKPFLSALKHGITWLSVELIHGYQNEKMAFV